MPIEFESAILCDVEVPGKPFGIVATPDENWLLVSLVGPPKHGIAVLSRAGKCAELVHVVPLDHAPLGLALSRDGSLLAMAHFRASGVGLMDVILATKNASGSYRGYVPTGKATGSIEVAFSPDGAYVFVSEEKQAAVSVVSLRAVEDSGYNSAAVVGRVPVDHMPVGMAISPDGRSLYVTSEATDPAPGTDTSGHASEFVGRPVSKLGTLTVIDVALAQTHPDRSVVARVPAGENPVRVALSHDGSKAWITSRANNQLLILDTSSARRGHEAETTEIPVGIAPVGVALIANDTIAVVANSNRFSDRGESSLSIVDVKAALAGESSVVGTISAGKFARELAVGPQGRTLFLTNFESGTVTLLDIEVLSTALLKH